MDAAFPLHVEAEVEQRAMDRTSTGKLSDFRNDDRGTGLRARLDRAIESALEDRRIVGTVVLVAEGGDIVYGRAAGFADREAGRPMRENCIFLLSSVAKPIVTATVLRLVEDGRIGLGDSVRRWLPEFKPRLPDGRVPEITIRHLLTHSAGLTYVFLEPEDGPYHRLRISNGHKWFIDPANHLTVVALTNTAFEGMIGRFSVDVRNAVYGV